MLRLAIANLSMYMLLMLVCLSTAMALDTSIRGHAKYQPTLIDHEASDVNSLLGPDTWIEQELNFRAVLQARHEGVSGEVHAEVLGIGGEGTFVDRHIGGVLPLHHGESILPDDDRRIFNLSSEIVDDRDFLFVVRLDRLLLSYAEERLVVRVGRQAITWGNALVFPVFDLFNPFSPVAIDKDYKSGDDILYTQLLLDTGADVQGIVVGRRDPVTNSIMNRESSYALKFHGRIREIESDIDILIARHFDESLFGVGFSRALFQAMLRLDMTLTEFKKGESVFSFVANVDRSWIVAQRNVYTYVEYFRSGVGTAADNNYQDLGEALLSRIARGELFTFGRDYLSCGWQIEVHPLVNLSSNNIFNLHDESGFLQTRADYDLWQDIRVSAGLNVPFGARESEYGGIKFAGGDGFFAPGRSIYMRFAYYF